MFRNYAYLGGAVLILLSGLVVCFLQPIIVIGEHTAAYWFITVFTFGLLGTGLTGAWMIS